MNKQFFILFSLAINCYSGFSQVVTDFLSINYSNISKSEFKDIDSEVQLDNFDINVITPSIHLNSKTKMNNILFYRFSEYTYNSMQNESNEFPIALHDIKYSLLTRHTFNSVWELLLIPRISIRGDFNDDLSVRHVFPAISAISIKTSQKNSHLKWGFGLNYNNDLSKNSVIPIIVFLYTNEKLRLTTYLPNNANLVFTSTKKLEFGFGFTADPTIYHITTVNSVEYLRTLNFFINPTLSYNPFSNLWLNLKGGLITQRNFDLYNANFKTPSSDFENMLKSSAFILMGLSMRTAQ